MFRCGRRCWLVQRWSLCACSRPNRSIFGLSSNSSRRTMPDRGLLFFMMWVDPLSYSCISVTDATHCWRFCFSFIFLVFFILTVNLNIFIVQIILDWMKKKKKEKKRSGLSWYSAANLNVFSLSLLFTYYFLENLVEMKIASLQYCLSDVVWCALRHVRACA